MSKKAAADISDRDTPEPGIELWLRRRRKAVLVTLIIFAVVFRVFCYLQLAASPCFWTHEWTQSDMNTFHSWAMTIVEGDHWSQSVRPPLHNWHVQVANDYARRYPMDWLALTADCPPDEPAATTRALWNHWCGGGRTYQGPLYPYLIAGTYYLLGPAVGWVFAWQMLLGIGSVVLVHLLARHYFGDLAALTAGLGALLYGPLLFYEFVLLRAALIVFVGLLAVLLLERARRGSKPLGWLWLGLLLGVSLPLKAHFAILLLAAMCLLFVDYWRRWRVIVSCGAGLVAGLLIGFFPVVVRNVVTGAPPTSTAANGPVTVIIANSEDASSVSWSARHVAPILAENDHSLLTILIASIETHPSLGHYLALLARKAYASCYWYEEPNNANFYYATLHSDLLRVLPLSFGVICPPAIVGLILGLRRFRRNAPLYFLVAANLVVLIGFFVFCRFRLPLVAASLPFAGFAVARLIGHLSARRWMPSLGIVAGCVVLGVPTLSPAVGDLPTVRIADVSVGDQVYYHVRLQAALSRGDLAAAREVMREVLEHQPMEVLRLGPDRPAHSTWLAELADYYAEIYRQYAVLLQETGRDAEAEVQLQRSAELKRAGDGNAQITP